MNLKFLSNVMHNGIIFKAAQPEKKNEAGLVTSPAIPAMVVDLDQDARGLKQLADSLIDRGLVEKTSDPATHSSNFVNAAQEAVPLGTSGVAPSADAVKKQQEAFKSRMAAEQPVTQGQMQQPPAPQPPAEQPTADKNAQPSEAEVAATAASVK